MTALELVSFDLETTGFTVSDEVTVVGFAVPMGVRVFTQSAGSVGEGEIEAGVQEHVDELVKVSVHASEQEMFEQVASFSADRLQTNDVLLIAYNGERWKGGFDLPFLRTRLSRTGVEWVFQDIPYADVMPVVTDRFNTTLADENTVQDLVGIYETLLSGTYGEFDPFDDSREAVTAFEQGRITELVRHNVADVLRTRALGRLAQQYCSKSDFQLKSLTATIDD